MDLAKQRKNVWMINHLQEARQAKGYDAPSYLKRLKMDKVNLIINNMPDQGHTPKTESHPVPPGPGAVKSRPHWAGRREACKEVH